MKLSISRQNPALFLTTNSVSIHNRRRKERRVPASTQSEAGVWQSNSIIAHYFLQSHYSKTLNKSRKNLQQQTDFSIIQIHSNNLCASYHILKAELNHE